MYRPSLRPDGRLGNTLFFTTTVSTKRPATPEEKRAEENQTRNYRVIDTVSAYQNVNRPPTWNARGPPEPNT